MDILGFVDIPGWILTILIFALTLFLYTTWCQSVWSSLGVPGPRPLPFLGINPSYAKKGIVGTDLEVIKKYGRVVGIYQGNVPTLLVTDPDIIKHFTVKDFSNFPSRFLSSSQSKLFRGGVFGTQGNQWKYIRNTLSPTFSAGKMRNGYLYGILFVGRHNVGGPYYNRWLFQLRNQAHRKFNFRQMVPLVRKCVDVLIENVQNKSEGGSKTIDMKQIFSGFTMDVIASTSFGLEVNSQKNEDDLFVRNAKKVLNLSLNRPIVLMQMMFPILKPLIKYLNITADPAGVFEFFESATNIAIEERKKDTVLMLSAHKERNTENGSNATASKDIPTRGLTNEEIMGNAITFFLAGYDTSANTLSFASYCLATNPEWQDILIKEIYNELGTETVDYDNAAKLTNLDMFVSEVLRMYNPASSFQGKVLNVQPHRIRFVGPFTTYKRFNRRADADVTVKGIHIPKGCNVNVSVYGLHMDPEFWPDPEKFDPLRFTKENKANRNPYTYLPFGSGPRNCIGMRLAKLEIKMVLVSLLRVLKFVTAPETEIPPVLEKGGLVRAQNGIKLKVVFRS